ncbi:two-component system histidine kinase PnpS [Bacillus sp. USDA818B3_A]|uniref:two-component system histidine kinase PnpS n=1 Tax=Bacillus sp. USDA818B3_A TaxID=2698834 RepID=UPI00137153AE|nr:HAMP domain-containing sensor histidine kinase [Bacillus sp. USDA818B3_A]
MIKFRSRAFVALISLIMILLIGLGILLGQYFKYNLLAALNDKIKIEVWWLLSAGLGTAAIITIILGIRITTRYTKPIKAATEVAIELAHGNYRARTKVNRFDDTGMLGSSINMLAENLQELTKVRDMQQDRLSALIENMGAGLILIDSRGFINLVNKGYIDIFQINPSGYLNKQYYEVIDYEEINQLIAEVFRTEQKVRKQLRLPLQIERKYFMVYGVPIIGVNNVWKGVLLVFHDISEIKKLEQMRKDFVANVSHELKTPVTSIKGFTETLLDGAMNNKETLQSFLSIILKESDRLESLIRDLLELSKIEQHGFQLNLQQVDLTSLLQDVINLLDGKAKVKNIELRFDCKQEEVLVRGDTDRLKQVFINLISNAISYTPADGSVSIILVDLEQMVRILVKDTGVGIGKEDIPRIFERFYRVDRARSRNSGGTGLGLAIVKHLIDAHHGSIRVKSKLGEGSEFIIELPKEIMDGDS